jgi:hypothetical protein
MGLEGVELRVLDWGSCTEELELELSDNNCEL